jgi:hypothetical protein
LWLEYCCRVPKSPDDDDRDRDKDDKPAPFPHH